MTAIQLRAELFREMNPLLDSELAMEKILAFVRSLTPQHTETLRQQAVVKDSLYNALDEVEQAKQDGRQLQSVDEFIKELEAEELL